MKLLGSERSIEQTKDLNYNLNGISQIDIK